jgi:hypothetical protein
MDGACHLPCWWPATLDLVASDGVTSRRERGATYDLPHGPRRVEVEYERGMDVLRPPAAHRQQKLIAANTVGFRRNSSESRHLGSGNAFSSGTLIDVCLTLHAKVNSNSLGRGRLSAKILPVNDTCPLVFRPK